MKNQQPPKRVIKFLQWFCPPPILEEIEGDLTEQYEDDLESYGAKKANLLFLKNVILFLRPGIVLRRKSRYTGINKSIIYNNFKVALRSYKSDTKGSLINLAGLTVGIFSSIIIFSVVHFEKSFDSFHSESEQIHRIVRVSQVDGETEFRTGVVYPLADAIRNNLPQVKDQTSILYWSWETIQVSIDKNGNEDRFVESSGFAFAEPSFFDIFDFKDADFIWLAGNPGESLKKPFSIVLTRSLARKYFENDIPLGEILHLDEMADFEVTGVIEDLPPNSDFNLKALISYSTLMQYIGESIHNWSSVGENQLYVKVDKGTSIEEMNILLDTLHSTYAPRSISSMRKYQLQPLSDIHSNAKFGNFNNRVVSNDKLTTLSFIGIFLLITACINFINLSTARGSLRAKEIGVRKTLGSSKKQLIVQFLTEAFTTTLFSVLLAVVFAELIIPGFQSILGTPMKGLLISKPHILLLLVTTLFSVTLAAGFYPAIVLSSLNPVKAIKSNTVSGEKSLRVRRYLVIAQFSLTMFFLSGTVVVMTQVNFFRNFDLGFKRDAIINLELPGQEYSQLELLRNELVGLSSVSKVSFSSTLPSGELRNSSFWDVRRMDSENSIVAEVQQIDPSYLDLYDISIVTGRNFRRSDTTESVIINETLASKLGYHSPEECLKQEVKMGKKVYSVIGIVSDFHSKSLKNEIDKIAFIQRNSSYEMASIEVLLNETENGSSNTYELIRNIEQSWNKVFPENVFNYRFFDENIDSFYKEENRFSTLLWIFTTILIFIGCLGLYGLILFVIERKTKEVAIRKIHGANFLSIVKLVNKDFGKIILLSFLIATPFSYYLMQIWLSSFVYHIEITWWMLLLPLMIVAAIAVVITSGQSIKAAFTNPAKVLVNE